MQCVFSTYSYKSSDFLFKSSMYPVQTECLCSIVIILKIIALCKPSVKEISKNDGSLLECIYHRLVNATNQKYSFLERRFHLVYWQSFMQSISVTRSLRLYCAAVFISLPRFLINCCPVSEIQIVPQLIFYFKLEYRSGDLLLGYAQ